MGTNTALAVSTVEVIATDRTTNLWPLLREELAGPDQELNRACAALMAGPVQFQPDLRGDIRLPYVAGYKRLAQTLAVRAVLAMHENDSGVVFTNLLALSRMATAWTPEPADVCHLVRFACVTSAEQAIWESMQTDGWNEAQLLALQREWESVRFFESLPVTAELTCANMVRICRTARTERYREKIGGWGPVFRGVLSSPGVGFRNLWSAMQGYRQHARYRDQGSYEDEKALLLYFRDRREELKRATACATWKEMQTLPGTTNLVVFRGANHSRIVSIMNLKQVGLGMQTQRGGLLRRAAEAETRRRLIVTAVALERFAIQHKSYPPSLRDLVPAFLPAITTDFMDGQELRYRRGEDGRYVLYSVGLDGVDNGGQMVDSERLGGRYPMRRAAASGRFNTDMVWPRPATQSELDSFEQKQRTRPVDPELLPPHFPNALPE